VCTSALDVSDHQQVARAMADSIAELGKLDVLVAAPESRVQTRPFATIGGSTAAGHQR
jgi:NAD(P)-dependent dehydrogenase (short-subunit alcohol dehydrogenase family)